MAHFNFISDMLSLALEVGVLGTVLSVAAWQVRKAVNSYVASRQRKQIEADALVAASRARAAGRLQARQA